MARKKGRSNSRSQKIETQRVLLVGELLRRGVKVATLESGGRVRVYRQRQGEIEMREAGESWSDGTR